MKIQDRVYGSIVFDEPVLIELIESPTLQRLRGVDMGGYYEVYFPGSKHSRFEHSLGVAWLLKRFGASLEEQVAGLLHDASHSAFSHAIDYAIALADQSTQSYQDDVHAAYLGTTEIPALLMKHGFPIEHILDDTRHPLKEQDLPDLCADRIDYILRGGIAYRVISTLQAQVFLDALGVRENRWVFRDSVIAREFAELFRYVNHTFYFEYRNRAHVSDDRGLAGVCSRARICLITGTLYDGQGGHRKSECVFGNGPRASEILETYESGNRVSPGSGWFGTENALQVTHGRSALSRGG